MVANLCHYKTVLKKNNDYEAKCTFCVLEVKNPCCASSHHRHNHKHLKHIQNIRNFWPVRNDYLNPTELISTIITRLENEDRRLDQINGGLGSLANALAKELYGDENQFFAWYK